MPTGLKESRSMGQSGQVSGLVGKTVMTEQVIRMSQGGAGNRKRLLYEEVKFKRRQKIEHTDILIL